MERRTLLLTRHAKSFANVRDVAFGNVESPLHPDGVASIPRLRESFVHEHGIVPALYKKAVAASLYTRTQQTAESVGFTDIDTLPVINEAYIAPDMLARGKIIDKHASERWVPDELQQRANEFVERIRSGEIPYDIYFTHGFFVAAVKNKIAEEHEQRGEKVPFDFDPKRGYIPHLATISKIAI